MVASDLIDPASQPSVRTWRSRLRGYLARRTRQLLRVLLFLTIGILFFAAVLEGWRGSRLLGLPDVGDPFDVAEFRAFRVLQNQDAILLLRRAQAKLSRMPGMSNTVIRAGPVVGWSKTPPELRQWVIANRAVLEMFREAAERPDGIVHPADDRDPYDVVNLGQFAWLALLEASRLAEQGDVEGAWIWYRALIRMKGHLMRRGSIFQRYVGDRNLIDLRPCIAIWAADRRTTVPMLRRALDDIRANEPKPEWERLSLRVEYLRKIGELNEEWGWVQHGEPEDQHVRIGGEELPPYLSWIPYAVKRYLSAEPERSRRVVRLAFTNLLAHLEDTDPRHLKPAVGARLQRATRTTTVYFYPASAEGPAAARELAPKDLAKWFVGSRDAKVQFRFWPWPAIRTSERREHFTLVVMLAEELYQRDHGKPPPSSEALVGPYLDHLPGDGSDELDDGSAPTIGDGTTAGSAKSP
jgi:hypothetical protein